VFFSGTAAEITPIRSVDRITIGAGGRGDFTERIQKVFFGITSGERPAPGPWLTYVSEQQSATPGNNGLMKGKTASGVAPAIKKELVARAHAGAD